MPAKAYIPLGGGIPAFAVMTALFPNHDAAFEEAAKIFLGKGGVLWYF